MNYQKVGGTVLRYFSAHRAGKEVVIVLKARMVFDQLGVYSPATKTWLECENGLEDKLRKGFEEQWEKAKPSSKPPPQL